MMPVKDAKTVLKEARSAAGRAYRSIGNAMSLMSPAADQNALRYAVAQLDAAAASLRPLVLGQATAAEALLESGHVEVDGEPRDWYFVDYSLPKSAECPTGRANVRLRAFSESDAIYRAAKLLIEQGLGLTARMNHARKDEVR